MKPKSKELKFNVRMGVAYDSDYSPSELRSSVWEAIHDALLRAEENGFNHPLADDVSIILIGID